MNEKHYHLHKEWILLTTDQEKALAQKHNILERYKKSSKELPEIPLGSKVLIHEASNRGIHQWKRSGTVTELLPHRQYKIKCNHSGKITIRNNQTSWQPNSLTHYISKTWNFVTTESTANKPTQTKRYTSHRSRLTIFPTARKYWNYPTNHQCTKNTACLKMLGWFQQKRLKWIIIKMDNMIWWGRRENSSSVLFV